MSKSGAISIECSFEPCARIDEKHGVVDVVLLGKLGEKDEVTLSFRVGKSLT